MRSKTQDRACTSNQMHTPHTKIRLDCCSFCVTRTIFLAEFIVAIHLQLNLDLGRPFSCLARHRATLPVAFSVVVCCSSRFQLQFSNLCCLGMQCCWLDSNAADE